MGWSEKYKKSINCDDPKGFSQRAHCQGKEKKMNEEKKKDHEYSMARSEIKTIKNAAGRLQKKMGKKGEGELQAWVQSKITKAADYIDTAADYVTNEETKSGDEGLRDWFGKSKSSDGKKGWVQLGGKWAGKPCARQPGQTSTPKCGSSKMAANLSDEEEESARRRKNRQDPNQPEKTGGAKPTNVATEETDLQEVKDKPGKGSGKKDACYHKVKSRYSVWPSAYASGALVKCRKVGAANWGNKSESVEIETADGKTFAQFIDIIKPEPLKPTDGIGSRMLDEAGKKCWTGYEKKGTQKLFGKTYNRCVKKEEVEEIEEVTKMGIHSPHEVPSKNLKGLVAKAVKRIDADVDGDVDSDDPKETEMGEFIPSPDGKKKIKPKVRFEGVSNWREELGEDWQKVNKSDKTDGMSQKAVNAYRRENPGSKLKTAVTEKDPGPGRSKRRKSFCARSKGQQDMHNIDCSKDPDKAICKARRRWRC